MPTKYVFIYNMAANNGSQSLRCIIHYNIKDDKYSKVKTISEITKQQILVARNRRIAKSGPNHYKEQCDSIPDEIHPLSRQN